MLVMYFFFINDVSSSIVISYVGKILGFSCVFFCLRLSGIAGNVSVIKDDVVIGAWRVM